MNKHPVHACLGATATVAFPDSFIMCHENRRMEHCGGQPGKGRKGEEKGQSGNNKNQMSRHTCENITKDHCFVY